VAAAIAAPGQSVQPATESDSSRHARPILAQGAVVRALTNEAKAMSRER